VTAVSLKGVSKQFSAGVTALDGIDLDVEPGEFVSLIGPSGCGKSTLLRIMGDLIQPSAGTVVVNGKSARRARIDRDYGIVFQDPVLYDWRTVARNIALGLEYRGVAGAERDRRVREAITLSGLQGFEDAFPATLSGGMRQRVALMRTLVVDPEVLLMVEPFGALDTHTKLTLHDELLALWGARRQTVVFVTHDLSEAITLADRILVITRRPGRVKLDHEVKLPRPRDVIALRETDEYAREYGRIWHVLGEEFAERAQGGDPR
jgi:NitT/TauT family transport system ATP-binding protein